jgi:GDP-mannose 6-dehydrogenase
VKVDDSIYIRPTNGVKIEEITMHISIFGLGYVGAVCAGCLSARGHNVVGVDISSAKIDLINQGKSPIVEPGLGELLEQGIKTGNLRGTTDFSEAIRATDVSMICVGTPSKKNGDLELDFIESVCVKNLPATPS